MRYYELGDKPGRTKNWKSIDSTRGDGIPVRCIYHYSTLMLWFDLNESGKWDGNLETVKGSTGHGSVSDQRVMNEIFARLEMPLYFRRAGGTDIERLDGPQFRYGISKSA